MAPPSALADGGVAKPRRSKPGRKTGPQTEARILSEATTAFANMGYEGVSVRLIAERAGITIPTIYIYFKDKRALYLKCCLDVFQRSSIEIMQAFSPEISADEQIYCFVKRLTGTLLNDPHLAKLFHRELLDADTEGLAILERDAFRDSFSMVEQTLAEAGVAPKPLTALSIYALTFGLIQYMQVGDVVPGDLMTADGQADGLARHVLRITVPEVYDRVCGGMTER